MQIAALQKITLLDYPGKLACTVFLPGCNLRCPFCHNASLVLPEEMTEDTVTEEELADFLKRRKGKLDGVCLTGGEPTLREDLPDLIRKIKEQGYLVKLDTNGSRPQMLRALIKEGLLDYVAMDVKNSPRRYRETCGGVDILAKARESVALLKERRVPYEFRTTLCHPLHDKMCMEELGQWLQGAEHYFLQGFVDSGDLVGGGCTPFTEEEMQQMKDIALKYIPATELRGV